MRSINGVQTSPEVAFLIEERTIGIASYRQATAQTRFDDLAYNFNFDVRYAGEIGLVRVASVFVDIIKDLDYIFVLTGTLADPSILTWETVVREFTGTETVFEARFTHTSDSLGSVDYFFAAPGVDPVAGEEAGTLAFGEVLPSIDFEAGEYVLTITSSGMPDQVCSNQEPRHSRQPLSTSLPVSMEAEIHLRRLSARHMPQVPVPGLLQCRTSTIHRPLILSTDH